MDDPESEFLWRFYQDHITHGRHHETLRATTTTVLLAIAAGVLGILGTGHTCPLLSGQVPLTVFLILLGIFGAFFSSKYHERFNFHMFRAREYRTALEARLPTLDGSKKRGDADGKAKAKHPWLYHQRLHRFWMWLHLSIAAIGVILTASIFVQGKPAAPDASLNHHPSAPSGTEQASR
jgi:hypothetical protein